MDIAVIGSGGREHALIKKLKENPAVETVYALPGNGGIAADAVCVPIGAKDIDAVKAFCLEKNVRYAVVAPDDPLVLGMVDALEDAGIPCFGPRANAAIIEGSKAFSKDFMKRHGIPTADYRLFDDAEEALSYVSNCALPVVVKADGLALGKGVLICETREAAEKAIEDIMRERVFGASGSRVVVEEFLTGPEISVLAFTDGKTIVPMVSSMDHKRALDGDKGLNTGGMGVVAPNPYYTDLVANASMETIFLPTIRGMAEEGRPFKGCLYFGLMLTENGPKVIEYNCRFGDPEAQAVLALLKSDLLDVLRAVTEERLGDTAVRFDTGASCVVVLASGGYPLAYKKGCLIDLGGADKMDNVTVLHAGTKLADGELVTNGGRVLGVTAVADSLREAVDRAYAAAEKIRFEGATYRRDIGKRAMEVL